MFGKNLKYKIKTKNGWEDFSGVQKLLNRKTIKLTTSNRSISCTENHRINTSDGFIEAVKLTAGTLIDTEDGFEPIIVINHAGFQDVYDVINSGVDHNYYSNGIVSHNCEFLGSSNTLINAGKLRQLAMRTPLRENGATRIYAEPERGRQYIMTVDTSRGLGLDFSAYIIFDITAMPYTCAVVFRDSEISPLILPDILKGMAEHYNNCPILVETNDIGQQVADILYHDLEYENLVFATSNDRDGQYISSGFAGQKMHYGVRTTKQVKRIGTSNLKNIVENDKLIITDYNLIYELSRFVAHKQSFQADEGANDDLVMCCVLFAWMVNQAVFKDAGRIDIRQEILKQNQGIIEDQILSFGFMDGVEEDFVEDAREIQAKRNGWLLD